MTESVYSFIRAELRTLQNMCDGDNEKFLAMVADMIGKLDAKIVQLEARVSEMSWAMDDRHGGI